MSQPHLQPNLPPDNLETGDEGIEILVRMAESGEIDPWNLDISKVADQYLKAVTELKASDLRQAGKTLLYLAILLRMKSDLLTRLTQEPDPYDALEDWDPDGDLDRDSLQLITPHIRFQSLEEVIQRRTSNKQHRTRPVTLKDLIVELKKYEELEHKRSLREKIEKTQERRTAMRDYADLTTDDIENLAHEEFQEDTIFALKALLINVLLHGQKLSLSELEHIGQIDRVSAFIALLFLEARGEVETSQEAFYEELYIHSPLDLLEAFTPAKSVPDDSGPDQSSYEVA